MIFSIIFINFALSLVRFCHYQSYCFRTGPLLICPPLPPPPHFFDDSYVPVRRVRLIF